MRKIPTLFIRDAQSHKVIPKITPGCEWVHKGEGCPTRKWDGTACILKNSRLHKRYNCRRGRRPGPQWIPCEPCRDPITGDWPGWLPLWGGHRDRYHLEAFSRGLDSDGNRFVEGATYELCGPRINRNAESFDSHVLVRHGAHLIKENPRTYDELANYFRCHNIEGIVWWHPDGRKAKIKGRDFYMPIRRPIRQAVLPSWSTQPLPASDAPPSQFQVD